VALFDRSSGSGEPLQRQLVYRQPARKLQIELPDLKQRFAPGEQVQLNLQVTDETGQPVADARLGVRVWNEQLVQQSGEQPILLADAIREGNEDTISREIATNGKLLAKAGDVEQQIANQPAPAEKAQPAAGATLGRSFGAAAGQSSASRS